MPHEFEAQDGDVRTTAFPGIVRANGTTIPVSGYAFDAATEEALFFRFRASDYTSGNVVIDLDWYPSTATSGNVVWSASLSAITPGDANDLETDALSTAATTTTAATGTRRLARTQITITATESLVKDDQVVLRIARVAANGSDTMTGDAILTYVYVAA